MSYKLFLDDYRIPLDCIPYMHQRIGKMNPIYLEKDWVIVKDHDAFVKHITKYGLPEIVSFDHDLADEHYATEANWDNYTEWVESQKFKEKTGYDCAKWLIDYCMEHNQNLPFFIVHSMNPSGTENILSLLTNFKNFQESENQTTQKD